MPEIFKSYGMDMFETECKVYSLSLAVERLLEDVAEWAVQSAHLLQTSGEPLGPAEADAEEDNCRGSGNGRLL